MEYEIVDRVLVLKGNFEALSTGVDGGRRAAKNILNIQVPHDFSHEDPKSYIEGIAASLNLDGSYIALLTAVEMKNVQILNDACVTVFITAGLKSIVFWHNKHNRHILCNAKRRGYIAGAIITATEAKAHALFEEGLHFTGTTTDAMVVAYENSGEGAPILYSGPATPFGRRVTKLVRSGVKDALKAHYGSDDVDKWLL